MASLFQMQIAAVRRGLAMRREGRAVLWPPNWRFVACSGAQRRGARRDARCPMRRAVSGARAGELVRPFEGKMDTCFVRGGEEAVGSPEENDTERGVSDTNTAAEHAADSAAEHAAEGATGRRDVDLASRRDCTRVLYVVCGPCCLLIEQSGGVIATESRRSRSHKYLQL